MPIQISTRLGAQVEGARVGHPVPAELPRGTSVAWPFLPLLPTERAHATERDGKSQPFGRLGRDRVQGAPPPPVIPSFGYADGFIRGQPSTGVRWEKVVSEGEVGGEKELDVARQTTGTSRPPSAPRSERAAARRRPSKHRGPRDGDGGRWAQIPANCAERARFGGCVTQGAGLPATLTNLARASKEPHYGVRPLANLLLILVCLVAGVIARRQGHLPAAAPAVLSRVVIDVALPALTLNTVHGLVRDLARDQGRAAQLLVPAGLPWIGLGLAVLFLTGAARPFGLDRRAVACLVLSAGFANTSFVGFPLVEALYGDAGLKVAVIADLSSFLMVASAGPLVVAVARGGQRPTVRLVLARVLVFPPFLAFVGAMALGPVPFPDTVTSLLTRLGSLVVPLALLAVGLQLRVDPATLRREGARVALGLAVRLAIIPAVFALILRVALRAGGLTIDVAIIELAMSPMITSCLLAIDAGLEPELATLMMGLGVPLSLLTVPLWAWLLR